MGPGNGRNEWGFIFIYDLHGFASFFCKMDAEKKPHPGPAVVRDGVKSNQSSRR
jgi:hypothetical protein